MIKENSIHAGDIVSWHPHTEYPNFYSAQVYPGIHMDCRPELAVIDGMTGMIMFQGHADPNREWQGYMCSGNITIAVSKYSNLILVEPRPNNVIVTGSGLDMWVVT